MSKSQSIVLFAGYGPGSRPFEVSAPQTNDSGFDWAKKQMSNSDDINQILLEAHTLVTGDKPRGRVGAESVEVSESREGRRFVTFNLLGLLQFCVLEPNPKAKKKSNKSTVIITLAWKVE